MTEFDEELGPLALEIIEEFGKLFNYVVVEDGTYDPSTQANVTPEPTRLDAIKMAPPEDVSGYSVANGLAEAGDKKLHIPAQYFIDIGKKPSPLDKAEFDGATWTVREVQEVFSGELPCLYIVRVGK